MIEQALIDSLEHLTVLVAAGIVLGCIYGFDARKKGEN